MKKNNKFEFEFEFVKLSINGAWDLFFDTMRKL